MKRLSRPIYHFFKKNHTNQEDIDFVVLWVDGSDPQWQARYGMYSKHIVFESSLAREKIAGKRRYRNWDTLRYLFRGIEAHAPWFRKIHLITCGHFPAWLNTSHPKLNLLTHHDIFRDHSHLPTFNSTAIHANLAGIKDLAEEFVLFDDDTLIVQETPPSRFFEKGLPKDFVVYDALEQWGDDPWWLGAMHKNILKMHKHFKLNPLKILLLPLIHPRYGRKLNYHNLKNFMKSLFRHSGVPFSPLHLYHHPRPLLRQSVFSAASAFKNDFIETSKHRFRNVNDTASPVYQHWHLLERKFIPFFVENESRVVRITNYRNLVVQLKDTFKPNVRFLCINDDTPDSISPSEELLMKGVLIRKLEKLFPEKSAFEI